MLRWLKKDVKNRSRGVVELLAGEFVTGSGENKEKLRSEWP
jgi:hypothetical protein